jgi:type IV secretory pathway VirB10-like protein
MTARSPSDRTELGSNANDSAIASALRQGSSNSLSQTGQQITQRNLNIQPTLTIRPGFPVRVMINRDLVLTAWQERPGRRPVMLNREVNDGRSETWPTA